MKTISVLLFVLFIAPIADAQRIAPQRAADQVRRAEKRGALAHVDDERRLAGGERLAKGCYGYRTCVHGSLLKSPAELGRTGVLKVKSGAT